MDILVDSPKLPQSLPQSLRLGGQGPSKRKSMFMYWFPGKWETCTGTFHSLTHLIWVVGWQLWLRLVCKSQVCTTSQLSIHLWLGNVMWAAVRVFTPQEPASATNQGFFCSSESWWLNVYQQTSRKHIWPLHNKITKVLLFSFTL